MYSHLNTLAELTCPQDTIAPLQGSVKAVATSALKSLEQLLRAKDIKGVVQLLAAVLGKDGNGDVEFEWSGVPSSAKDAIATFASKAEYLKQYLVGEGLGDTIGASEMLSSTGSIRGLRLLPALATLSSARLTSLPKKIDFQTLDASTAKARNWPIMLEAVLDVSEHFAHDGLRKALLVEEAAARKHCEEFLKLVVAAYSAKLKPLVDMCVSPKLDLALAVEKGPTVDGEAVMRVASTKEAKDLRRAFKEFNENYSDAHKKVAKQLDQAWHDDTHDKQLAILMEASEGGLNAVKTKVACFAVAAALYKPLKSNESRDANLSIASGIIKELNVALHPRLDLAFSKALAALTDKKGR